MRRLPPDPLTALREAFWLRAERAAGFGLTARPSRGKGVAATVIDWQDSIVGDHGRIGTVADSQIEAVVVQLIDELRRLKDQNLASRRKPAGTEIRKTQGAAA